MIPSESCVRQIGEFEGCRLTPYNDVAGNATVGYGHLLHHGPVTDDDQAISETQADVYFAQDLDTKAGQYVNSFVKVTLSQNQFDALVSFTYNLGAGTLQMLLSSSGLNGGQYGSLPAHLIQYDKARVNGELVIEPGLLRRRQWEAQLWNQA